MPDRLISLPFHSAQTTEYPSSAQRRRLSNRRISLQCPQWPTAPKCRFPALPNPKPRSIPAVPNPKYSRGALQCSSPSLQCSISGYQWSAELQSILFKLPASYKPPHPNGSAWNVYLRCLQASNYVADACCHAAYF